MTLEQLKERPLSYSSLKQFAISPAHYINYLNKEREETPALIFGSALHCALLQEDKFKDEFVISPKFDMRKTADKEAYAKFQEQADGKKILPEDVYSEVFNLVNLVKENPEFVTIISDAVSVELREEKELFGLPFVFIKDIQTTNMIVDIKTVQSAAPSDLNKDFFNYDYPLQAAIYGDNFHFYVVEKNQPYYNGLIGVDSDWFDYGNSKLERLCIAFNYALEHPESFTKSYDFWYKLNNKKPIISLPGWVKR